MPSRSDMRASDSDRERVVEILQEAHTEGRLDQDELMNRIESAYGARTYRQLDDVIDDLPIARRSPAPLMPQVNRLPRSAPPPARRITLQRIARTLLTVSWWVYGATVALSMVIWFLVLVASDEGLQYLWPLWVAGPWGVVLGTGELAYRSKWGDRPLK
ncbi:DUF1707 domain-containing protein [Phytoactinopolyspora alkaliphila]|uniref:DUF1707 domain-containing protein n=1 Tax=Phytoactinopolyspora alkaliphila TaxID=1783498 RepID=A0A6N9YHQ3_9ACTN|nr:DUF1707 domain-containing protein [Phytoactinopolyspora alkaliphila]NED94428.1 DUF1707 domain-containing protein [Phytoactinopolyspora alkaliphila]